jgi:hypothetical protein
MRNECFLDAAAQSTGADIVDRHAPGCPQREALVAAIARLARIGLEGHVRLWESEHKEKNDG